MPKRFGGPNAGLGRDPLDFRGVERSLVSEGQVAPILSPVPNVRLRKITAEVVAGFAWTYLRHHYDKFKPTTLPNGNQGWAPLHVEMWDLCCSDEEQVAIAAPRLHAKSTSLTLAYGLANICTQCEDYLVIVSDTFEGQAVEQLGEYRRELTENEALLKDFRIKKIIKNDEGNIILMFEDRSLARIKALAMEGAVRGLKWRNKRPGLFIIDDAENPELVANKIRRAKSRGWIMKDLIPAGREDSKVRMIGTILHHDASLARFCNDPAWKSKIYRAHKSFNDFSEILWPEMWPEERLRKVRQRFINQNDSDGYSQEYLNDPISPTDAYFKPDDIVEMEDRDFDIDGVYYIGWDVAVSKEEKYDFTAASIWKVDDKGRKYLTDVIQVRIDSMQVIDLILGLELQYNPRAHFMEKGVIDKAIGPFLDAEMTERQCYPNIVKINRPSDKETFAKPLQGMIGKHAVKFNKKMAKWPEVWDELMKFLKAGHDDIIDSMAMVAQGLRDITKAPTQEEKDDEAYLFEHREPEAPEFMGLGRNPTTGY